MLKMACKHSSFGSVNLLFRLVECMGGLDNDIDPHLSSDGHNVGVTDLAKGLWVFLEGQACCTPLLARER